MTDLVASATPIARRVVGIILAGGSGQRFGAETPKQFIRLAGEPLLRRSAAAIAGAGICERLIVVAHPEWLEETEAALAGLGGCPITIVSGGATRNESTRAGLAAARLGAEDIVLIHDAVRPLLTREVIERVAAPLLAGAADAVDTVIPTADTLVEIDPSGTEITAIPDRGRLRRGQTPQGFLVGVLERAYAAAPQGSNASDDCTLVLRHVPGARLIAVPGDEENIKITTRIDMVLADRLLQLRAIGADRLAAAMPDPGSLTGRRILIAGGTSGIGQALVDASTRAGAKVHAIGKRDGYDFSTAEGAARSIDDAVAAMGGLDDVIVTAGILRIGELAVQPTEEIAEMIAVNLTASLYLARAAYPHLAASRGSLTLFSSSSFTRGRAQYAAYSASKAAVVNLAQALADEWIGEGIRVNAIAPERANTPMRRAAFPNEDHTTLLGAETVAHSTLSLIRSGLTGQIFDVRRAEAQ